jgi:hypothetical protein
LTAPSIAQVTEEQLELKIRSALDKPVAFEFVETSLLEVVEFLSDATAIEISIDRRALDDVGVGSDTPITRALKGVSLRSALKLTLNDLDLAFMIRDGSLVVTTPEEKEAHMRTRVYSVTDVVTRDIGGKRVRDFDELTRLIMTNIQPETWDEVGGPSSIQIALGSLVVSSTSSVHDEIHSLLKQIRTVRAAVEESPRKIPAVSVQLIENLAAMRIENALDADSEAEFVEHPLSDAMQFYSEKHNIPVVIDVRALDEVGIGSDTPITLNAKQAPLRLLLRRMLRDVELTTLIADEVLIITTPETAEARLDTRLYPMNDLAEETGRIDFDEVIQVLTTTVEPDSWSDVGGPGAIEVLTSPPALVISQTSDVHTRVAGLLTELRRHRPQAAVEKREPEVGIRVYKLQTTNAGNKSEPVSAEAAAKYAEIVRKSIDEKEWVVNGALIETADSNLVIRHYPRVHRQVEKLLMDLDLGFFGGATQSGAGFGGGY